MRRTWAWSVPTGLRLRKEEVEKMKDERLEKAARRVLSWWNRLPVDYRMMDHEDILEAIRDLRKALDGEDHARS